ncbi:MAG: exopolysaccharide biosynthesis protein [Marinobacter sp.]
MNEPHNLQDVLDRISQSISQEQSVTFGAILDTVGRRSYGPVLLTIGILLVSPLSAIPGVPTLSGVLVLFISSQMLILREGFWLPGWLVNRTLPSDKLMRGIRFLEPVAHYIDARLHARLVTVVRGPGSYLIGSVCMAIACAMPLMEIVPMSATAAGFTLAVFGLALVAMDGLLALLGLIFAATIAGLITANTV